MPALRSRRAARRHERNAVRDSAPIAVGIVRDDHLVGGTRLATRPATVRATAWHAAPREWAIRILRDSMRALLARQRRTAAPDVDLRVAALGTVRSAAPVEAKASLIDAVGRRFVVLAGDRENRCDDDESRESRAFSRSDLLTRGVDECWTPARRGCA